MMKTVGLFRYKTAQKIEAEGYPFYALIQAAMRQADTDNLEKLKDAFPEVWSDLQERYFNPGGLNNEEMAQLTR
jgi:hypothetical protein